jgi:formylglycine-generating enzyme required for sulfatase activity
MSAGLGIYRDEMEVSYAVDFGRDREPTQKRSRHPEYRRKGSAPTRVSGMHCRRNKRWTWGSGRGARMQNARAFAGCLAFAVASLAASAFGVTINYNFVGNPGNPGNSASNPAGLGAVSDIFKMATTETTNQQYVDFLNTVDPNGSNPNSIYNASMGSSAVGGITFNAGGGSGAKYTVKSGTASTGGSYATMPVSFVTWFSAARFANWLQNGQVSGTAAMETGAYTLNGATSGNIVARNPGAQVFLPSVNEWYKAAFYTGTGSTYTTWQTNSNSTPTATVTNVSLVNAANYSSAAVAAMNVGSYINSTSAYGMYDMLGNVAEMTDNTGASTSTSFRAMGGGWGGSVAAWNGTSAAVNQLGTFSNQSYGFRVAAVPEPGTIALAGMGIAGLAGLDWMKRRKKRMAARQAA